jgi:hypothetical protein
MITENPSALAIADRISAETAVSEARDAISALERYYARNVNVQWEYVRGRVDSLKHGIAAVEDSMSSRDARQAAIVALTKLAANAVAFVESASTSRSRAGQVTGWNTSGALDPKGR